MILYILYFGYILYTGDPGDLLSKSLPRLTLGEWEPFLVQIVVFPYSELLTLSGASFPYSELLTLSIVGSVQIVDFPYNELLTIYLRLKRG